MFDTDHALAKSQIEVMINIVSLSLALTHHQDKIVEM